MAPLLILALTLAPALVPGQHERPPGFWIGYFGTHISHFVLPGGAKHDYPIFTSDARVQVRGPSSIATLDGRRFRWFDGKRKVELRLGASQLAGWFGDEPIVVDNSGAFKISPTGKKSRLDTHFSNPTFVVWQQNLHLEFVATMTESTFYASYGGSARVFSCPGELLEFKVLDNGDAWIDSDRSVLLLKKGELTKYDLPDDIEPGVILDENEQLYFETASEPDATGWTAYSTLMRYEGPGKFKQICRLKGAFGICEVNEKSGQLYALHFKRTHFGQPFVRVKMATEAETVLTDWVDDLLPDNYLAVWQNADFDQMAVSSPRGSRSAVCLRKGPTAKYATRIAQITQ